MKATYFYSEEQRSVIQNNCMMQNEKHHINFAPNGREYTQCDNQEGEHVCNRNDSVIVQVLEDLPLDEATFEATGKSFAKTP